MYKGDKIFLGTMFSMLFISVAFLILCIPESVRLEKETIVFCKQNGYDNYDEYENDNFVCYKIRDGRYCETRMKIVQNEGLVPFIEQDHYLLHESGWCE